MKILIIEDNSDDVRMIRKALEDFQCDISYAETLHAGIDKCEIVDPDIILLDINLPDANKNTLIESISGLKKNAAIIVLSRDADERFIPEVLAAGADDYIDKNVIMDDVPRFLLRVSRAWNTFKNRLEMPLRMGEVDSTLFSAQKKILSDTTRLNFDRDRISRLSIEQNLQILVQLNTIEKKVDHTNGTVRDHTKDLAEIKYRHNKEDERIAEEKMRQNRIVTGLWAVAGTLGTGIILLLVNWISHAEGWVH